MVVSELLFQFYFFRAPKSTDIYKALERTKKHIRDHRGPLPGVPLHLRNAPTKLMKDLGKNFHLRLIFFEKNYAKSLSIYLLLFRLGVCYDNPQSII